MDDKSFGYRIFKCFNIAFFILLSITFVYPYINTLAIALNDPTDSSLGGITIYPRVFTVSNFYLLLSQNSMLMAAFITLARVISGTLIALLINFAAGYAFTKRGFRGRGAFQIFMIIPMYIGGGLIPYYLLLARMGMMNRFWVYIIPGAFSFFNMVIVRVFISSNIPESLEEAARLDGANDLYILYKIILPLSAPIIATVGLFTAVGYWNDWTTTLYFVTSKNLFTLQFKLMQVLRESETLSQMIQLSIREGRTGIAFPMATPESIRSVMIIVTTLPIILFYPFLQKYFLKGAVIGALKD